MCAVTRAVTIAEWVARKWWAARQGERIARAACRSLIRADPASRRFHSNLELPAPRNRQQRTGDRLRIRRKQKCNDRADLFRFDPLREVSIGHVRTIPRGVDRARQDGVDCYPLLFQLFGER